MVGNEDEGPLALIPTVLGKESELPDQRALLVIGILLLLVVMRFRAYVTANQSLGDTWWQPARWKQNVHSVSLSGLFLTLGRQHVLKEEAVYL